MTEPQSPNTGPQQSAGRRLERSFFDQSAVPAARQLLGKRLVRLENGQRLAGLIVETEAYCGEQDLACHARAGRTPRTQVMYGPPGHAYVYFTYGMHWLFNCVVAAAGTPEAVLVRALLPQEGLDVIAARRGCALARHWTDGPGKLCQALDIDRRLNGSDLCDPQAELFVEWQPPAPDKAVTCGPRVGLNTVPEPWKSMPWRFLLQV